jgi:hypothetical protein
MGTPQFNTGPFNADIDHPLQLGWTHAGLNAFESGVLHDVLQERFGDRSQDEFNRLGRAVVSASHSVDAYREAHERANLPKLQLDEKGLRLYAKLAAGEEYLKEQIEWFGGAALSAFQRANIVMARRAWSEDQRKEIEKEKDDMRMLFGGTIGKIALEVRGKRQFGDWLSTKKLDEEVRSIPEMFSTRTYDDPAEQQRAYKLEGRIHFDAEQPFEHIIIRRRRIVADIGKVEIFKESTGLVVWSELSDEDKEYIHRHINLQGVEPENIEAEKRKVWAYRIGEIFEIAIAEKDSTKKVIPLSAHYVKLVRNPELARAA